MAPVLFNTFINDLYKRIDGLLIKSAGDTELGDLPNTQEDRMKLQFILNRLRGARGRSAGEKKVGHRQVGGFMASEEDVAKPAL